MIANNNFNMHIVGDFRGICIYKFSFMPILQHYFIGTEAIVNCLKNPD